MFLRTEILGFLSFCDLLSSNEIILFPISYEGRLRSSALDLHFRWKSFANLCSAPTLYLSTFSSFQSVVIGSISLAPSFQTLRSASDSRTTMESTKVDHLRCE